MGPRLERLPGRTVAETTHDDFALVRAPEADPGELYRRHVADVTRWVRRFGTADADIEDVVHDVFLVALRRRQDFDPRRAAFGTWLFGVTAKVTKARRRRDTWRARIRRAFPWWSDETRARAWIVSEPTEDLASPEQNETCVVLQRLLDELGEKYRTAIVMFELEGLSCDEIAAAVGCSVENVYVRVHRARRKMAAALARHQERVTAEGEQPATGDTP
jgi:RNA polymerase sigma-70 factor (ECF subfamily)